VESLSLIHLSDLHIGERNRPETNVVLQTLLKDVDYRLKQWNIKSPYLAISGDLTYGGRKDEFKLVSEFLSKISDKTDLAGTIFCPGNHDLNWTQHTSSNTDLMEDLIERGEETLVRINKRFDNEREREELRTGMSNYYDFLTDLDMSFSPYLYSLQSITIEQFKVNFIGFNSSYLFCNKHNWYGYVGLPQLERGFDDANTIGDLPDDFRVFNISLMHHPFSAIVPVSQVETENIVKSRSDIILNGHFHTLKIYIDLTSSLIGSHNTRGHPIISTARCVYDEVRDPHIIPGYSIMEIGFERDKIKNLSIYEIRFDKSSQEWFADPNNPNLDIPLPLLVSGQDSRVISKLKVADSDLIRNLGWNLRNLVKELMKLDNDFLTGIEPSDEGTLEQWIPSVDAHPDTWRVILGDNDEVVGYWHYVPLFDEDFEIAKGGKLLESNITTDRVPEFEIGGHYHLYFVMIALKPEYRHTEAIHLMYHSFFSVLEQLAEEGIFFDDILTNAFTPSGVSICKSFKMSPIAQHISHGTMFYSSLFPIKENSIMLEHPKLVHLYQSEYKRTNSSV
jgi:predicted MPP superfamily phosphohydrolase